MKSGMVSGSGKEHCRSTVRCAKVSMAIRDGGGEHPSRQSEIKNPIVSGVHSCWMSKMIVWITWLSISLCSATSTAPTVAPGRQETVCTDIDIRNRVNFSKLENCTVIEGSLQILLIDYADPSEYENLHFPMLLEITDYLLLYRVYGMKTLAHIFPNLSVIRGQKLFFNYAVVAFEMPDLEELGLPGLTHIVRGAVRLEKNANLCYINTIDWGKIARAVTEKDHFISQNKDIDECVNVCPRNTDGSMKCPTQRVSTNLNGNKEQPLCWTAKHCQKTCPARCSKDRACYLSPVTKAYECCHEQCIGGCSGPQPTQCFACKNVLNVDGRCQTRCTGTYKYLNRRCIVEADCKKKGKNSKSSYPNTVQWKLHNHECIRECPSGYMEAKSNGHRCDKCNGPCPRVCLAKVVDSVSSAQELKGCTVITGMLEIQIRGGSQVGRELEENLGLIEKVTEYVKIVRSFAIVSLNFLKSLKVIQGNRMFNNRYSFALLDNQNLQDIWDLETHPKLQLLQGILFFHRNHKLCYHKIKEFVASLDLKLDDQSISPVTNGDQIPCNITQIKLEVNQVKYHFVVVKWTALELNDERQLLSYVIYYKESPAQNLTIFNAKDSCGSDDWQTFDVRNEAGQHLAEIVYDLKPWTQYAMYVQTYTLSSTTQGGISKIIYFTTQPTAPTHPRDVKVRAMSPNELKVTWLPPNKPNGNVTHYMVYWQPQPLKRDRLDQRNYCLDKLQFTWKNKLSVEPPKDESSNITLPENCCKCPKSDEEKQSEEEERQMEIEFQNFLQDTVYIKRPPKYQELGGIPRIKNKSFSVIENHTDPTGEYWPKTECFNCTKKQLNQENMRSEGASSSSSSSLPTSPQSAMRVRRRRRRVVSDIQVQHLMQGIGLNSSYLPEGFNISSLSNMSMVNESDVAEEDHIPYLAAVVYGQTEIILSDLKHFQEYNIEVIACHDPQPNGKNEKQCSNRAITTGRTLPLSGADELDPRNFTVTQESEGSDVKLKWMDPIEPNGLIVSYEIGYKALKIENSKVIQLCIPHIQYRKVGGYIISSGDLQSGNYSFRLRATSLAGNGTWTAKKYLSVRQPMSQISQQQTVIIVPIMVVFLLLIVVGILAAVYIYRKRVTQGMPAGILYASVNPEYISAGDMYVPDEWEVPRDKIKLGRELGQGSFGMVHEGLAKELQDQEPELKVAVKTVNEKASIRDRINFLNEASVMKAFNCNHVVKLLGVVSKGQPTMVIMELMAFGDLKYFLRLHRPDEEEVPDPRRPPTLKQILQMAGEIADGMAYLAAKKYVHRDLAARNCMVAGDCVVKVGDFGMTRDIYETDYYREGGRGLLPVRWMAPESLRDGIFTSQSDIWSYGVVMWEMATLAAQPYQGISNEQVLKYVIDGGVMQQPHGCPDRLYELMLLCWRHSAKRRPTFCEIVKSLESELSQSFKEISYYHSEDRINYERDREKEIAENAAMAAAQASAIGPEDFEPAIDEDLANEDITTPLTGSPRFSTRELEDLEEGSTKAAGSSRRSLNSLDSQCSHRHPCQCIDRDNTSGSNQFHLNGMTNGHVPRAYITEDC